MVILICFEILPAFQMLKLMQMCIYSDQLLGDWNFEYFQKHNRQQFLQEDCD